jgi:phosphotransferase system HPr-like phosphotransfer protein
VKISCSHGLGIRAAMAKVLRIFQTWSCDFEFEKNNNKQSLKIDSCTQKKTWYVKCNKTITALHFVQYNVLWSTEKQDDD